MMITIYNPQTGIIDRIFSGPAHQAALQLRPGEAMIEGEYRDTAYYMVSGKPVARPALNVPVALPGVAGTAVMIATTLPAETFVAVDGVAMGVVDDGVLEIEPGRPGEMTVLLTAPWPYKPATIRIDVNETSAG